MPDLDPDERELRQKTLAGDIAHRFHTLIRGHLEECWRKMPEARQRDLNEDLVRFALRTAEQAIDLALGAGIRPMCATIKRIAIEDGVKVAIEMPALDEAELHALVGARKQTLKLVGLAVHRFQGAVEPLPVDPADPKLPLDGEAAGEDGGDPAGEPERQAGIGPEEAAEIQRVWAVQEAHRREAEEVAGVAAEAERLEGPGGGSGGDADRSIPRFEPAPAEELDRQEPRKARGRKRQPNTGVYRHEPVPA